MGHRQDCQGHPQPDCMCMFPYIVQFLHPWIFQVHACRRLHIYCCRDLMVCHLVYTMDKVISQMKIEEAIVYVLAERNGV